MLTQPPENNILPEIDLSFGGLMHRYKAHFSCLPEVRKGFNTTYKIQDAVLGAFSVFFMQCPSFLAHQKQLHQKNSTSNAQSLFFMDNIPSDNQIRNLLDKLSPELLNPLFDVYTQGFTRRATSSLIKPIPSTITCLSP